MPIVTEVGIGQLASQSSKSKLGANENFIQRVETLLAAPGCLKVVWDVMHEDNRVLVLLIEWATLEDHLNFRKSPVHDPHAKLFLLLLDEDDPVRYMYHYELTSSKIFSPEWPTLELLAFALHAASDYDEVLKVVEPITRTWDTEKRPWVVKRCIDEGEGARVMFVIARRSVEEQNEPKEAGSFKEAVEKTEGFWKSTDVYGHITP